MKKLFIFSVFFCLLSIFTTNAQEYKISGTVEDETGPLPNASVLLFADGEEKQVAGEPTDLDGKFTFSGLEAKKYRLEISFMGFTTKKINVILTPEKPQRNFKKISMQEDDVLLKAVEVSAKRSSFQVDIDKKTFLVNESAVSEGMSATEVLSEIPSVDVDVDGNITMRNNENVEIYINGRPSGLTDDNKANILEQLPAGSIDKVEVISNPSSKYSAEGSAGIINIVMKQNTNKNTMYYGSVAAGISYPWGGKPGGNVSANINFVKNKWTISASAGYNNRRSQGGGINKREYYNENDTTLMNQENESDFVMNSAFFRLGLDCQIDSLNRIGLTGMFSFGGRDRNQFLDYTTGYMTNGIRYYDAFQKRNSYTENFRLMGNAVLDYEHKFEENHTLGGAINFSTNKNDNDRLFEQRNFDSLDVAILDLDYDQNQTTLNKNLNVEAQIDYLNTLNERSKLEAGLKASLQNQASDVKSFIKNFGNEEFIPQENLFNDFEMQQNVYSAYASYGNKFRKFAMQLGLRGELTDMSWKQNTTGEKSNKKPYFDVFPTAFFSYTITEDDELQLSYTRRISRPKRNRLNPYTNVEDSTNIRFGNPDLDPEFTNSFEFNYVKYFGKKKHTFITSAYYQLREDVIQSYSWRSNNALMSTYQNMTTSHSAGLDLTLKNSWKVANLTTNFTLYYYKLNGGTFLINNVMAGEHDIEVIIKDRSSLSWNAKMSASFILPKNFNVELTGNYRSPKATAQGKTLGTFFMNLGAKKTFFDKRLALTLSVRDLLNSRQNKSETWDEDFYQYSESFWSGRTINLNVSYSFGNMKSKNKKGKNSIGGDDGADDMDMDF